MKPSKMPFYYPSDIEDKDLLQAPHNTVFGRRKIVLYSIEVRLHRRLQSKDSMNLIRNKEKRTVIQWWGGFFFFFWVFFFFVGRVKEQVTLLT